MIIFGHADLIKETQFSLLKGHTQILNCVNGLDRMDNRWIKNLDLIINWI